MIHIIIADDHRVVIDGLVRIFNESDADIDIAGTAEDGDGVLELLKQKEVDIVILDISMPGMEGAATLKSITHHYPQAKVLILTMHNDADRIKMMIQNGAKGYLLKNRSGKELISAIKTLSKGECYFPNDIQKVVFESHIPREFIEGELKRIRLTEREEEVLLWIAKGDRVKDIAKRLHVTDKTIVTHKTNLMEKIGARNVQDLVRYAVKNGYCPD